MRVIFTHNQHQFSQVPREHLERHKYLGTQFERDKEYNVYGVLLGRENISYLLCNSITHPVLLFYPSFHFNVTDRRCSKHWIFIDNVKHELDWFDQVTLIGPSRLLDEPSFYRSYIEYEDRSACNYMEEYKAILDSEFSD